MLVYFFIFNLSRKYKCFFRVLWYRMGWEILKYQNETLCERKLKIGDPKLLFTIDHFPQIILIFVLMDYPSKVLAKAVDEISGLPGIGRKTALRLALHLLKQPNSRAVSLGNSLINLVSEIKYCKECHNFSDFDICEICSNEKEAKS